MIRLLLCALILNRGVRIIDGTGRSEVIGSDPCPEIVVRLSKDTVTPWHAARPTLLLGEAYMDRRLVFEAGDIYGLLALVAENVQRGGLPRWVDALRRMTGSRAHINPPWRARRNVAHHYDLRGELYRLFLDADLQYSCAVFRSPHDSLETAQENKKRTIARKLLLNRPDLRVLEIGSGWGGLALHLAANHDVHVTGLTLSEEQLRVSRQRAAEAGLSGHVSFRLQDYREEVRRYDRIVSVGMFEHVGKRHYRAFFKKLRACLAEDGVCLLHSIAYADGPGPIDPFISKYIFPGADLPSLSEVMAAVEAEGLQVGDIEILGPHYAETLRHWRQRFLARRAEALALFDDAFCCMWEYYLALCEISFRYRSNMVFQMQLTATRHVLPWTRDYLFTPAPACVQTG